MLDAAERASIRLESTGAIVGRWRSSQWRWIAVPLSIALGVRLAVFAIADIAVLLAKPEHFGGIFLAWLRKDAHWYVSIAKYGYSYSPSGQSRANFFPLYPMTMRLTQPLAQIFPPNHSYLVAGMLVSWITFCGACVLLYRLVYDRFGHATALGVVLLLATFPFSFYYGAAYSESLYLLLAVLAFLGIERRRWWLAGIAALLASAERPPGLLVGACVVLAYMLDWLRTRHPLRWDVLALALTPLGAAAYILYCWISFGFPFAYIYASHAGWQGGHLQLGGILMAWHTLTQPADNPIYTIYVVLFVLFLLSLIPIQRLLGLPYTLFAGASIVAPVLDFPTVNSLGRYMSIVFPTFIVLAYGMRRWPLLRGMLTVVSILLLGFFAALFVGGFGLS